MPKAVLAPSARIRALAVLRTVLPSWPAVLPTEQDPTIRPLALSTRKALNEHLIIPEAQTVADIRRLVGQVLHRYTTSAPYLLSLCRLGAERHDLDGNPVEPVSEEHRTAAQRMLDAKMEFRARAAARSSKPVPETPDGAMAPVQPVTPPLAVPAPVPPAAPTPPPQIGKGGRPILKLKVPPSEAVSRLRDGL
jgi:sRNA-binding protein